MPRSTVLRAPCPFCGRLIKVSDPGHPLTPWVIRHRNKATGKLCRGSCYGVTPTWRQPPDPPPEKSLGEQLLAKSDDITVKVHCIVDSKGHRECEATIDLSAILTDQEALNTLDRLFCHLSQPSAAPPLSSAVQPRQEGGVA